MRKFIELNDTYSMQNKVIVAADHIQCMHPEDSGGTWIFTAGNNYCVKESMNEILNLLYPRQQSIGPG